MLQKETSSNQQMTLNLEGLHARWKTRLHVKAILSNLRNSLQKTWIQFTKGNSRSQQEKVTAHIQDGEQLERQQHSGKAALRQEWIILWLVICVTPAKSAKSHAGMHNQQVASLEIYSGTGNYLQNNRTVLGRKMQSTVHWSELLSVFFVKRFQCPGLLAWHCSLRAQA